jgi:FKBP-type peptidyl-prolyl cis-trans isomerase
MNRLTVILLFSVMVSMSACTNDAPEVKEPPLSAPLQINDLTEGTGDPAETGDTVLVHYTGWLYKDGTRGEQFDTSRAPGRGLFEVIIGETLVMQGWTRGLVGMKVGGVRQLIIPPELAFGGDGKPPTIPPSSTLEFEIELHGIVKPNKPPSKP